MKLNRVISLNLSDCRFCDKDIHVLKDMNLRILNLSSCQRITGKYFNEFRTLKRLDLTGCKLAPAAYSNIREAGGIQRIFLANTSVTDRDIQNLRGVKKGSSIDEPAAGGQTTLAYIDLRGCDNITTKTITFLMKDLRDNQIRIRTDDRLKIPKLKTVLTDPIHSIKDPLRKGDEGFVDDATLIKQINVWKDALSKRVGQLWKHEHGLRGHIIQIQEQLRRLTPELLTSSRQDSIVSGEVYSAAVLAQEQLRAAVLSAKADAIYSSTSESIPILSFPFLPGKDLVAL